MAICRERQGRVEPSLPWLDVMPYTKAKGFLLLFFSEGIEVGMGRRKGGGLVEVRVGNEELSHNLTDLFEDPHDLTACTHLLFILLVFGDLIIVHIAQIRDFRSSYKTVLQ